MKNKSFFFLIFFLITIQLYSQKIIQISKSELISKVSENNISIKISEQEFKTAKADYIKTNAVFLPNITASHTGISTTNPLMSFGSKLNQGILIQNDFNPALLNNPIRTQNFTTKLEVQQPLINLDGIYQRKAAKSKMEAMHLKTERTKDYYLLEVEKTYMELQLAHKAAIVLKKALKAAKENKNIAENSFKEGLLLRADVLNVEISISEIRNSIQIAKSNIQNVSNYLSFLMNDGIDVLYEPIEKLTISALEMKAKTISENRSDIRAMQLVSKGFEAMNKAGKMSFLPRLNAFGSYEMYDQKVFQGSANGYLIGAQLSWDIFKGSKRFGDLQKSKADVEKSKLQYNQYVSQSNLELNKVKLQLDDAKSKLKLTDIAMQQSKESLRIRKNRFKEGLEKTADLLQMEAQYLKKQLAYYQAIYEYNYTQAYLQFLTKE